MKKKQRKPIHTRLSGKMFLSYALFAGMVLGVLWISQTFLLDRLYSMVKSRELEKCADTLAQNGGEQLSTLDSIA